MENKVSDLKRLRLKRLLIKTKLNIYVDGKNKYFIHVTLTAKIN